MRGVVKAPLSHLLTVGQENPGFEQRSSPGGASSFRGASDSPTSRSWPGWSARRCSTSCSRFGYARSIAACRAALVASDIHAIYAGRVKTYTIDIVVILGLAAVLHASTDAMAVFHGRGLGRRRLPRSWSPSPWRASGRVARAPAGATAHVARATAEHPNIVMVMTDDQTVESMRVLTKVHALIAAKGCTFANSFVVFSLCCPSRATYLTGQYAHNHHVHGNIPPRRRLLLVRPPGDDLPGRAAAGGLRHGAHRQVPQRIRPARSRSRSRRGGPTGTARSTRRRTATSASR